MSSIAGVSPFLVSGDLGLGTSSILGGDAAATSTVTSVAAAADPQAGAFAALTEALSPDTSPTIDALKTGKLTNEQHTVIAALGAGANDTASVPWNTDGTEPPVITQLRQYNWIKLVKPEYDPTTKIETGASYQLTALGKAIFDRTGGSEAAAANGVSVVA